MVVDIKRCIDNKIVIWCTTNKQSNQIWQDYHEYFDRKPVLNDWFIENKEGFEVYFSFGKYPSWQDKYNKKYFIANYNASCCLDYKDVLLNKEKIYELW